MCIMLRNIVFCVYRKKPGVENPYESSTDGQNNKAYDDSDNEQTGFWVYRCRSRSEGRSILVSSDLIAFPEMGK